MILYRLKCKKGHEFEAWFASSGAFDTQAKGGHLTCPVCATNKVGKALMAPRVAKPARPRPAKKTEAPPQRSDDTQHLAAHGELAAAMRKLRAMVEANSEYVGSRFCDEARKIHHEEAPARGIHGEATSEEAKALREEGIEFFPLPVLPEERN